MENNNTIREDWEDYYKTLEAIRRTGVCNMFEADVVLTECYRYLDKTEARDILLSWMENYDELNKKYGWQPRGNNNDEQA